jgi:crossover junction endodeoxyribonuclease RuvC
VRPPAERILGIDPGTAATGFAVIDRRGTRMSPLWYDCLKTSPREAPEHRLVRIAEAVRATIAQFQPDVAAIEELYFGASARSALAVGQARGVMMLVCAEAQIPVFEYTPAVIKQSVTGYGQADKAQVQRMVQHTLAMSELPRPDHCADAFAVAITHAGSMRLPRGSASTRPALSFDS